MATRRRPDGVAELRFNEAAAVRPQMAGPAARAAAGTSAASMRLRR